MRFHDRPDATLADVREAALCKICGGPVTVTVEVLDDDPEEDGETI